MIILNNSILKMQHPATKEKCYTPMVLYNGQWRKLRLSFKRFTSASAYVRRVSERYNRVFGSRRSAPE